jgi:hypothetical protein
MAGSIKVNGWITIWKEWESTLGKTEGDTKESIKMTKSMVTDSILGQTRDSIKACGTVENSMDLVSTLFQAKR